MNFIQGDAFKLSNIVSELGIEKFDCVISALPLLNFPTTQRIRLVNSALEIIEPGRPMVQFSYSPRPPVPRRSRHFSVRHLDTVIVISRLRAFGLSTPSRVLEHPKQQFLLHVFLAAEQSPKSR